MLKNNDNQTYVGKKLTPTMKIVLTAVFVALSAVVNAFVTIRITTELKFSLALVIYFMAGYCLGAPLGFVVGFVGDLLGWLLFVDGAYNPIIGVSNGLLVFIPGILFGLSRPFKKQVSLLTFTVKAIIGFLLGYLVCTVCLSSIGIWIYTSFIQGKYGTLTAWIIYRAGAQFFNTFVNLILTIIITNWKSGGQEEENL